MADNYRKAPSDENDFSWDPLVHARTVIESTHRMIHDGFSFHATGRVASLANLASLELLITTGAACYPHISSALFSVSDAPLDIKTYKNTTVSASGSAVTINNRNLNSSNTPGLALYTGPTITGDGTQIHDRYVPAQGGTGVNQVGVITPDFGEEWILVPSSNYLVRLTNNSGGAVALSFEMLWYEPGYDI
jgi:hypothetical protein